MAQLEQSFDYITFMAPHGQFDLLKCKLQQRFNKHIRFGLTYSFLKTISTFMFNKNSFGWAIKPFLVITAVKIFLKISSMWPTLELIWRNLWKHWSQSHLIKFLVVLEILFWESMVKIYYWKRLLGQVHYLGDGILYTL